jgi:hypothetical protein
MNHRDTQPALPRQLLRPLGGGRVDVAADDSRALRREQQRAPLTDTGARAGDEGDLAGQPCGTKHIVLLIEPACGSPGDLA